MERVFLQREASDQGDKNGQGTPCIIGNPWAVCESPFVGRKGQTLDGNQNWTYIAWRRTKELP